MSSKIIPQPPASAPLPPHPQRTALRGSQPGVWGALSATGRRAVSGANILCMELTKWGHLEMKIAVNASTHLWNILNVCRGWEATLALFNSSDVTIPTPQPIAGCPQPAARGGGLGGSATAGELRLSLNVSPGYPAFSSICSRLISDPEMVTPCCSVQNFIKSQMTGLSVV